MVASGTRGMIADLRYGLVTGFTASLPPNQTTTCVLRPGISQTFERIGGDRRA